MIELTVTVRGSEHKFKTEVDPELPYHQFLKETDLKRIFSITEGELFEIDIDIGSLSTTGVCSDTDTTEPELRLGMPGDLEEGQLCGSLSEADDDTESV